MEGESAYLFAIHGELPFMESVQETDPLCKEVADLGKQLVNRLSLVVQLASV